MVTVYVPSGYACDALLPGITTADEEAPVPFPKSTVYDDAPSPIGVILTIPELSLLISNILERFADAVVLMNDVSLSIPSSFAQPVAAMIKNNMLYINLDLFMLRVLINYNLGFELI